MKNVPRPKSPRQPSIPVVGVWDVDAKRIILTPAAEEARYTLTALPMPRKAVK